MRYALSLSTIQAAVQTLADTKSHEQIVLYFAILRLKVTKGDAFINGDINSVIKPWLVLPGREEYPYYRPFASRGKQFWMNGNLAGSFAPSSLRASRDLFYTPDGANTHLRLPSVTEIVSAFKIKDPIPLWAVACFLLRNACFEAQAGTWKVSDVLAYAKEYLGISEPAFSRVFDFDIPDFADNELDVIGEDDEFHGDKFSLKDEEFRRLTASDLKIKINQESQQDNPAQTHASSIENDHQATEDSVLNEIIEGLETYSGVILSGAPGTSKSHYARRAAEIITGDDEKRMAFVQFHPSYQYEDFMQGYRPSETGAGFEKSNGVFFRICSKANEDKNKTPYVLVIDELSRGDSQRIFGEALTYIEKSKRGIPFTLSSGDAMSIPDNLYLIATMNPIDKGADEVDLAFGRRFGTIQMDPSVDILRERLTDLECPGNIMKGIIDLFIECNETCSRLNLPGLGHTFLWDVNDLASLERSWRLQIKPHLCRLLRFEKDELDIIISKFENFLIE